jgi:hypothetical protein
LNEQDVHVITDGGVNFYKGTNGFVISDSISVLAKNHMLIYSIDFHQYLFRSEMYTLLAGIVTFNYATNMVRLIKVILVGFYRLR